MWENIRSLQKVIGESGVPNSEYARFLFLYKKGLTEEYNVFKNKEFNQSIEKGLVERDAVDRYELDMSHRRN